MYIRISKNSYLCFETGGIDGFCAVISLLDFDLDRNSDTDWDSYRDEDSKKAPIIPKKRRLRAILDEIGSLEFTLFIGDCKGGGMDTHLFPFCPKRAFSMEIGGVAVLVKPQLSPYYRNENSGNMVRHLICIVQRVKSRGGKKKV